MVEPGLGMTIGQRDDWNGKALLSTFIPRPRGMINIPTSGEMLTQATVGRLATTGTSNVARASCSQAAPFRLSDQRKQDARATQGAVAGARVRRTKVLPGNSTLIR